MREFFVALLFIVCVVLALVPIGLCALAKHDDFLEIQKDSENEK